MIGIRSHKEWTIIWQTLNFHLSERCNQLSVTHGVGVTLSHWAGHLVKVVEFLLIPVSLEDAWLPHCQRGWACVAERTQVQVPGITGAEFQWRFLAVMIHDRVQLSSWLMNWVGLCLIQLLCLTYKLFLSKPKTNMRSHAWISKEIISWKLWVLPEFCGGHPGKVGDVVTVWEGITPIEKVS